LCVIYRLTKIEKDIIPANIIKKITINYDLLKRNHGFDALSIDLKDLYYKKYSSIITKGSCQQQLCNSLRLVNNG
jgi:hypothetical protein